MTGAYPAHFASLTTSRADFAEHERRILAALAKVVVDIVELRVDGIVAQVRQQELARIKDDFISATSHELRTPLTSIAGSLNLLTAGAAGELPERAIRLQIAHSNSKRLVRLVNDILDMDKLLSGHMHLDAAPLAVSDVIVETVHALSPYAAEHDVQLVADPAADQSMVLADRHRLVQVLTNLVSNAVKFSHGKGSVTVSARSIGEKRVRITVADQGRGIPEAFRSRIFSRFAQADASNEREKGGTGLGLSIVKELVTQMGGEVSFDSEIRAGVVFTWICLLPLSSRILDILSDNLHPDQFRHSEALVRTLLRTNFQDVVGLLRLTAILFHYQPRAASSRALASCSSAITCLQQEGQMP